MIQAKVIAASESPSGKRICTMEITFPRFILSEFNTHRVFSRNSASSRAIPFKKNADKVEENPFIPIAWQGAHKGMQGTTYLDDLLPSELDKRLIAEGEAKWLLEGTWAKPTNPLWEDPDGSALEHSLRKAREMDGYGVTKQLTNRLLEPWMWHTCLVTSTEWDNFFELRCPRYEVPFGRTVVHGKSWQEVLERMEDVANHDPANRSEYMILREKHERWTTLGKLRANQGKAEIHMGMLAEAMYDAYYDAEFNKLEPGGWHMPYGDKIEVYAVTDVLKRINASRLEGLFRTIPDNLGFDDRMMKGAYLRIATARCARISYKTLGDEPKEDYEADFRIYDGLDADEHLSPFEHCAKVMTRAEEQAWVRAMPSQDHEWPIVEQGWCNNFRGFIQLRAIRKFI